MNFNELFKHPMMIVIVGVSYFMILQVYIQGTRADAEIRAAFDELETISEELAQSEEPGHIKAVVQNFGEQVVEGLKAGFSSGNSGLKEFVKARPHVVVTDIQKARSSWKTKEKFIGKISNGTDHTLTQVKVTLSSFSDDGRLIDVNTKWLSDIKVITPNESVSFTIERSLGDHKTGDEELNSNVSQSYSIEVSSFEIKDLTSDGEG